MLKQLPHFNLKLNMKRQTLNLKNLSENSDLTLDQIQGMSLEELEKVSHYFISKISPSFMSDIKIDKNLQAKIIASYVRNNIEDFHCEYLSDEMMKELNPLIRNAIYTALVDFESGIMNVFLHNMYVPNCWEDCEYCQSI